MTVKELNSQLKDAIENEDYESASRLRDEINKRKKLKHLFFIKKLMISCIIISLFNCSKSVEQQLLGVWEN